MNESLIPQLAGELVATLADLCQHQNRRELVQILQSARSHFDETHFDNWNGGTSTWALRLEIPVHIFAAVEPRLDEIENEIGGKLAFLNRIYPNNNFGDVIVTPATRKTLLAGGTAPSDIDVRRLWPGERFRLFLSHVSAHRVAVAQLKKALGVRGIAAFVAHEDIEPSREWQREIELALRSMQGLAALITPDFHVSKWTDHEVGWSLGRGVTILPVRLGADPYGLMGKFQGVRGTLEEPNLLAAEITQALLTNSQTGASMRRAIISSFEIANSTAMATELAGLLVGAFETVTDEEKDILWKACTTNPFIAGVSKVVYSKIGEPYVSAQAEDDLPF